jgi:hypothetical protein
LSKTVIPETFDITDESILDLDIPKDLEELLEDPEECSVPFEEAQDLWDIFLDLEEKNLKLIDQAQASEDQIEQLR